MYVCPQSSYTHTYEHASPLLVHIPTHMFACMYVCPSVRVCMYLFSYLSVFFAFCLKVCMYAKRLCCVTTCYAMQSNAMQSDAMQCDAAQGTYSMWKCRAVYCSVWFAMYAMSWACAKHVCYAVMHVCLSACPSAMYACMYVACM